MPVQRTTSELSQAVNDKKQSGEYFTGDLIAPKQYKVVYIDPDGNNTCSLPSSPT